MIVIDGSIGEGGGQVLRTSLALSIVTQQAFRAIKIRAGREKPGLQRQHMTSVLAAAKVCGAKVTGCTLGSRELYFEPGQVRPGRYEFSIGTAGSTTLVLQTVLPALMVAPSASELTLEGGTHNPWAPPMDFLQKAFLPLVAKMGARVSIVLERPGFFPIGGGRFSVFIEPRADLGRLELVDRGEIISRQAKAIVSRLPEEIARRELRVVGSELRLPGDALEVQNVTTALGPGNAIMIEIASANVTEVFTGIGRRGVRAEQVASAAVAEAREYLAAGVPVGPHLADQLLVPMAIGAARGTGDGRYRTIKPTLHTTTNIDVIRMFLDVDITASRVGEDRDVWEIAVGPPSERSLK